jgi:transposase InsO family protein
MRKYGLETKRRRNRLRKVKDERNLPTRIPNRLKEVCPIVPDFVWVGDFTCLVFYGTSVYLATVLDLFTREVIGISMGLHHSAALVIAAMEDAKKKQGKTAKIFHSDQGREYASKECRLWLLANNVLPSHSHKAHPWENGHQESFFGRFKQELGNIHRFKSLESLMEAVYHHVYYYNTRRIHSRLKMSPREFRERHSGTETTKKHPSTGV